MLSMTLSERKALKKELQNQGRSDVSVVLPINVVMALIEGWEESDEEINELEAEIASLVAQVNEGSV